MDIETLAPELEARLAEVVAETGQPRAFHIEAALADYLDDLEDHALAEEAMRDYDPAQNICHEEMKRRLGLEN